MIDLSPVHLETIRRILSGHVPGCEVRAFGSRVTWTAKEYSDLDLAIVGDRALDPDTLRRLKEAFEESDLPFRVDIIDWHAISANFRNVIETKSEILQEGRTEMRGGVSGWYDCTLADACRSIDYGLTASATDQEIGPRFLRITDIAPGHINWNSVPYVAADAESISKYKLHDGDIVLARTGASTGASAFVKDPPPAVFASYLVRLQAKPEFDSRFLAYYLKSDDFWGFIHGVLGDKSAQPNASASTMTKAPLRAPRKKDEQRAIAHILGTLDDKIELNRRMNETLEKIARALFKSWFVDFDPVRAKAEGRDTGLPKHIADLFPDSFEDSELGEIPKGWRVGSVDGEFDLTMGQSPSGETYNEAGVGLPFYQGCTDFGFRFPTRRIYCSAPTRLANTGDTLVSVRAPVGDINMATEDCAIGRGVAAVRHKSGSRLYSYHFMQSIHAVFARFEAEGTVFGSIGKKDFHAIACVNPPRQLVLSYEALMSPIDGRVEVNERESCILSALRTTLLPKLISGEVQVPAGFMAGATG